jgi:hypothetical protein
MRTHGRRTRALAVVSALAASTVLLAGCSQVAALAPVSGDKESQLRTAAIDKLLELGVDIWQAPVCETTDTGWTCTGSTTDKRSILVFAPNTGDFVMTITMAGQQLYSGPVAAVVASAAEAVGQ